MLERVTAKILLDRKGGEFMLGEPIKGELLVTSLTSTTLSEVGLSMFLDDGDKDVLISKIVLGEQTALDQWQGVSLHFEFNEEDYVTFLILGHDLEVVLEPYVVAADSDLPVSLQEEKLLLTSDYSYEILDDEMKVSIPFSPIGSLILGFIAVKLYFFLASQFGEMMILVAIGMSIIGIIYLVLFFILGKLHFEIVQVDENSFNVISDNVRIWNIAKEACIWYDVRKEIKSPGNSSKYENPHRSKNTFAKKETGLWASMTFPYPPIAPQTCNTKSVEVGWNLRVKVKTKIGFDLNYAKDFKVKRIRKLAEKSSKDTTQ